MHVIPPPLEKDTFTEEEYRSPELPGATEYEQHTLGGLIFFRYSGAEIQTLFPLIDDEQFKSPILAKILRSISPLADEGRRFTLEHLKSALKWPLNEGFFYGILASCEKVYMGNTFTIGTRENRKNRRRAGRESA